MAEESFIQALAQEFPITFPMKTIKSSSLNLEDGPDQKEAYPPNSIHESPCENKGKKRRRGRHEPEPEWSEMVREEQVKRQRITNRSRHACDRCRMKKSRCEINPNESSCIGCWEAKIPCFVTDRVLNVTSVRGEPAILKSQVDDLEQKLKEVYRELSQKIQAYEKEISNRDDRIDFLTKTNEQYQNELLQHNRDRASYPDTHHDGFTQTTPFGNPSMGGMNIVSDPSMLYDHAFLA
ncbi:hypothetical protein N7478_003397 [Penicillium angulare]|uniref:uncharacterized protein n=1 Tax=Penicillium angulare TaxID=116970 RepID=UPI00253FD87D|nr:uncharacterized protein N7478_003397 [Penicillium angulare]KAJ5287711.1 hypothetical protein N7478_003397 [Penicillium angulare]